MRFDPLTPEERSQRMGRVRGKDTKPEMIVRRLAHRLGFRYRLHGGQLPGRPDLVFPGRHKLIFVHGCFWHQHENCRIYRQPRTRQEFWMPKLESNKRRDEANQALLRSTGWGVLVVWECELRDREALAHRLTVFLDDVG
jgi:DNA mismatch endonuclease (patch repair protein)